MACLRKVYKTRFFKFDAWGYAMHAPAQLNPNVTCSSHEDYLYVKQGGEYIRSFCFQVSVRFLFAKKGKRLQIKVVNINVLFW